jgi:arylsulfatase A-like enzyme
MYEHLRGNENTIFVISGDNGPWEEKCALSGSVGPFIGMWQASPEGGGGGSVAKKTIWEAGHRVPSIIYWPQHIEVSSCILCIEYCRIMFLRTMWFEVKLHVSLYH